MSQRPGATGDCLPFLLLLGGSSPTQGLRCVRQAQARGLRVWLTDTRKHLDEAAGVAAAADRVDVLDYQDFEACVAWALERAVGEPVAGVYGFREYSVLAVAEVACALGLPGNLPEVVRVVRNKANCRAALRDLGFEQPASRLCADPAGAAAFAAAHPPGPWIAKPPGAMGSLGVALVRDPAGFAQAWDAAGEAGRVGLVVETYQPGEEMSAEGVFVGGTPRVLALTAKMIIGGGNFVELGHVLPADLPADTVDAVERAVAAALRGLGLRWGMFHVEYWIDRGRVVLGEVHARPGGDYLHLMVEQVTGIDLYGAVFDQMLGRRVDPAAWWPQRGAAIRYFALPPGVVTAVEGFDRAARDPACLLAQLDLRVGDRVRPIRASEDRPGFLLTVAPTAREAVAALDRLHALVCIEVTPET